MYTDSKKGGAAMLELGNEAQVREALEGKTGYNKEVEDELIRRVAITELEQEEDTKLSGTSKGLLAALVVISIVMTIVSFF